MQTSVEARPPFLDHQLVEFVYQEIPYDLKLHWTSKDAEKEAIKVNLQMNIVKYLTFRNMYYKKVSESYLTDEIIYRRKVGCFPVPLTRWFPQLEKLAINYLSDSTWFNKEILDQLNKATKGIKQSRVGQIIWMFINIEICY